MTTTAATATPSRTTPRRFMLTMAPVVAIDLATKATAVLTLDGPMQLGPVSLRVSHNSGVAFGVGNQLPTGIVAIFTALITVALVVAALQNHLGPGPGPALVAGGALANVIDRAHNSTVVDIIDLGWWPTFNLADTAIVLGIALIVHQQHRDNHADLHLIESADKDPGA